MRTDSSETLAQAPLQAPLPPAGAPRWSRAARTLKFRMALLVSCSALLTGAVSTHFVVRESHRLLVERSHQATTPEPERAAAALQGVQQQAWVLVAVLAALCLAGGAALAAAHTRPLKMLRARAHRMLDGALAPHDGWPRVHGEIAELADALRDVTLQHAHASQGRQTMVQQLQAILANASVGIMITRNGRFELVGRQLCQMFGYTEEELLALRTSSIYQSEAEYIALGPRMRADLTAHGHFDGELIMRRKNGREFWVHMLGRAVIPGDSNGGTIWILEDISQAREARDKLSWTATHDSLTGLVNRKEFEARLDQALTQFQHQNVCVMFIDLDKFKAVNDTAGHAAGDEVLRAVAALFEAAVRQSDTVARLGGDEFAILLPGCPQARAAGIAEQVRAAVAQYGLQADGQLFTVGTSIGLAAVTPDMPTVAAVLHAADTACYAAKRGGRNQVVCYAPPVSGAGAEAEPATAT